MFTEMRGYAEAASFDELSRITAKDALDKFIQKLDLLDRPYRDWVAGRSADASALPEYMRWKLIGSVFWKGV